MLEQDHKDLTSLDLSDLVAMSWTSLYRAATTLIVALGTLTSQAGAAESKSASVEEEAKCLKERVSQLEDQVARYRKDQELATLQLDAKDGALVDECSLH